MPKETPVPDSDDWPERLNQALGRVFQVHPHWRGLPVTVTTTLTEDGWRQWTGRVLEFGEPLCITTVYTEE